MAEAEGVPELFAAIAACLPKAAAFNGIVMRSSTVRYANEHDFLSGDGAAAVGGRWNRRGIKAVYASLSPVTAAREAYQGFEAFGFATDLVRPRIFCGAAVQLQAVLALTDRGIRRRLGFTLEELLDEDWVTIQDEGDESWTQAIGRGAHLAGFEAVLAPSARDRPDGRNLIIFPERIRAGSKVEILGKNELPPHPGPPHE